MVDQRGVKLLRFLRKTAGELGLLLIGRRRVRRGMAAVLILLLVALLMSVDFVPAKLDVAAGQVSPRTIKAQKSIVFENKLKTAEQKRVAAEKVQKVYDRDPQVSIAVQKDISVLMAAIRDIQSDAGLDAPARVARLRAAIPFTLTDAGLSGLALSSARDTQQVEDVLNSMIGKAMGIDPGITQEGLEEAKKTLIEQINQRKLAEPYTVLARGVVEKFLRPNAFYNIEKTKQKQEDAMDAVSPVMVSVKEGEKVIGEGEIITEEHLAKLQALGLTRPKPPFTSILGMVLLVALLMAVVLFYLYQQNRLIYEQAGRLYLLGIIVVLVLMVGKAIVAINVSQWPEFSAQFGYMVPLAAAGMLIAILLDSRLAVLVVAVMSLLVTLMTGYQIRFGLVGFIGGITGVYSVSRLSQQGDLVRSGLYTSASSSMAIFTVGLVTGTPLALLISTSLALGVINGILSSVLTIGALPYLEGTFRLTSPVRLLELSHPNNVLLKKLLTEAPGTYHHSIIVGNLAEAAADAVGGDSLLVRVGSYYHDIGKLKRPYFFIENQMTCDNPHDKIAPSLSTLILTSHVKDGAELAREHRLPQGIIDIVEQHHGSGLVSYFYHKALENDRTETVTEEEFRYEGPKPQTKESAIIMLADSVEAAVRSLQNRTPGRVEGLIRKIIKDKLNDGQLDECDLTFKDLDTIATAFVRVFSGVFHSRIEYPDIVVEMERRRRSAGARKQFAGRSGGG